MSRRHQEGFLLLEVIIAGAMIATGLFAIMFCLSQCTAATRSVQNYAFASAELANKAAELLDEQAADWTDQEGEFEGRPGFSWARVLEATDSPGLWKQTITITWQERGQTVSDALVEYRYLPGKL